MTEIVKIIGVALVTAIASILLKATKPELSFAVTITGIIVIMMYIIDALSGVLSFFTEIGRLTGLDNGLIKILLKIVGVGYLTEFGAGILHDFGSAAIADKVTLCGKLLILILSIPVLEGLLKMIGGLLKLI